MKLGGDGREGLIIKYLLLARGHLDLLLLPLLPLLPLVLLSLLPSYPLRVLFVVVV